MNVVWSPLALEKLGDAADFIALDNPGSAERWVNEVWDKTLKIKNKLKIQTIAADLYSFNLFSIFDLKNILNCSISRILSLRSLGVVGESIDSSP